MQSKINEIVRCIIYLINVKVLKLIHAKFLSLKAMHETNVINENLSIYKFWLGNKNLKVFAEKFLERR